MRLEPGNRLAHYDVVDLLGKGGMGEVYLARDEKLGREVALKVLPDDVAADPERLKRFEREARAASALNHPNIVTIHEIGDDDGTYYIAMELVSGKSLREELGGGRIGDVRLLDISTQLATGLAKAHAAGIVHRDLKPDNVMLTEDGLVKVLDFGVSKLLPTTLDSEAPTAELDTAPGSMLGTVSYMSPEEVRGAAVDHRSDQFSLGVLLYELATGRRPFSKATPSQTLAAVLEEGVEPLSIVEPSVPSGLSHLIERCLEKDPAQRFATTDLLVADLRRVEVEPSSAKRKLSPAPLAAVGLLAIVVVMFAAVSASDVWDWVSGGAPRPPNIESIAVLPLDNLSGDPEEEYFVDGMTEALIAELAKVDELKVISRTSVMRFKGTELPLPEIARELGVDAVVEGSTLRVDDRVRITAQLIEAESDQHLWAESYDRELTDVLGLQHAVAEAIAAEVGATIGGGEVPASRTVSPEAYDAYLKGMYNFHRRSLDDALAYFQEAVRLQPDYALAYVGMAMSHIPFRNLAAVDAALQSAERSAPDLAEAHIPRCTLLAMQWRWEAAEVECNRAVERNPGSATAYDWRGYYLLNSGRAEDAIADGQRAMKLDPLSAIVQGNLALRLVLADRLDEALQVVQNAIQIDPELGNLYSIRGALLSHRGEYDEALESFRRATVRGFANFSYELSEAIVLAHLGRVDEAREIVQRNEGIDGGERRILRLAGALTALGETDRALAALEAAAAARNPGLPLFVRLSEFDPIRDHRRFQAVVAQLGLPE